MKLAAELRAATGGAASVEARCEARLMDARASHGDREQVSNPSTWTYAIPSA